MHGDIDVKAVGPALPFEAPGAADLGKDKLEIKQVTQVWMIFTMVAGLVLGCSIGHLLWYQLKNVRRNLTTVEEMILTSVEADNMFDTGLLR